MLNSNHAKIVPLTREAGWIRTGLVVTLVIDAALVVYSKLAAPRISFISVIGPLFIILVYAIFTLMVLPVLDRRYPGITQRVLLFGLITGVIFGGEILLEYIFLPTDNTNYGLVEFGSVFFFWFLSGLMAGYRSKSIRQGIWTAVAAAIISSVIWDGVLLITLHAFHGTSQQAAVWQAEGTLQDFANSGMKDFYTFTVEDLMGATFFHLLLGPTLAAVLGLVGGLFGKLFSRVRKTH